MQAALDAAGEGGASEVEEDDLQALLGARRRRNEEDAEMRERVAEDVETRMDNGVRIDPRLRGRRRTRSQGLCFNVKTPIRL